jgi:glucose/arabinose dehydrogenase
MYNSKVIVLLAAALALAACRQDPAPADAQAPAADVTEPASPPDAAPVAETSARPAAGALKSALPEGFELPFGFHRLYDNTGRTEKGGPQRRILVEYLDVEADAVRASLTQALQAKGFDAPVASDVGGESQLTFARADGASVVAKITVGRDKPRAENAKGTLHLVWNAD